MIAAKVVAQATAKRAACTARQDFGIGPFQVQNASFKYSPSFRRKPESLQSDDGGEIPAFAGMTVIL
jgi:hypothetical protein